MEETEAVDKRKEKIANFLKAWGKSGWIVYAALAAVIYIAAYIRTRNIPFLKDVTTGDWALGPDLDPWLFLRQAKYIVENGSLMVVDYMRYSPLGFNNTGEYPLHPYMLAWFHKIFSYLGNESITYSGIVYPVFMFSLTIVAFFLLSREIFVKSLGKKTADIIGVVSAFFLAIIPVFLPRTIAGIPEKESAAFLFMFLALYFFIAGWNSDSERKTRKYGLAALAGLSTAAMAFIWGGYIYIFAILGMSALVMFILGNLDRNKAIDYAVWLLFSLGTMLIFSPERYGLRSIVSSTAIAPSIVVLIAIGISFIISNSRLREHASRGFLGKVPLPVLSVFACAGLLAIAASVIFGTDFILGQITDLKNILTKPATTRLIQTVAENKQPYFLEWAGNFGPYIKSFPVMFWLFFTGSVFLFYNVIRNFARKERIILTLSYVVFLSSLVFSRYSGRSILNGENFASSLFYALGFLFFIGVAGFYYYKYSKSDSGGESKFKDVELGLVALFVLFFLGIVSARATVRTVMVLAPAASIITSYFVVVIVSKAIKSEGEKNKLWAWGPALVVLLLAVVSAYSFYSESVETARGYAPTVYNQQWQKAMSWVRENTPENAVFGHWWDYGYWIQSIGGRATMLDGGNAISYWNHMMGRYALTGTDERQALEFLYAHNTTHFLIDSTDIGKYGAFSSIGSDISYDRRSWIDILLRDSSLTQERKNSSVFVYAGSTLVDENIVFRQNNEEIFLPAFKAGLGAIIVNVGSNGMLSEQPLGVFVYQGKQYNLPLRYAYIDRKLVDFGSGLEVGVFMFPRLVQQGSQISVEQNGAMLYLSKRTVMSQLARLYLYNEKSGNFKLVHSEDDFVVEQMKNQGIPVEDFVFFSGFRGPIRIWEISYPSDIKFEKEYISREYPRELYYA